MTIYRLLHNIGDRKNGSNYNTREEILACEDILTFDGVYLNVWENRDVLKGKRVILFPMGDYLGLDNSFDVGQPFEKYCTMDQVYALRQYINDNDGSCQIGWHTWSHRDLRELSEYQIMKELYCPFECAYIAYPYGHVNHTIADIARRMGYLYGFSVSQGDDTQFAMRRFYLGW